jgi:hypothetical protein
MRPMDTYSLLWWPPERAYLVRYPVLTMVVLAWFFVFVFDFVHPVVQGNTRFDRVSKVRMRVLVHPRHPSPWRAILDPMVCRP